MEIMYREIYVIYFCVIVVMIGIYNVLYYLNWMIFIKLRGNEKDCY